MSADPLSSIRIQTLYLVRVKQLKGGRRAIRNLRRLTPKTEQVQAPKGILLKVSYEGTHGLIQMEGLVDQVSDRITVNPTRVELKGYLKTRRFELLGYDLNAIRTNLHGSTSHAQQE